MDPIIGKGHHYATVSLTEWKSRTAVLRRVERKTAQAGAGAVFDLKESLPARTHTTTAVRGTIAQALCWKEFVSHERIANELNTDACFAFPCSSWERAPSESMNRLTRQYSPKKRLRAIFTQQEVGFVTERLNNWPRECRGLKSPSQVFSNQSPAIVSGD